MRDGPRLGVAKPKSLESNLLPNLKVWTPTGDPIEGHDLKFVE